MASADTGRATGASALKSSMPTPHAPCRPGEVQPAHALPLPAAQAWGACSEASPFHQHVAAPARLFPWYRSTSLAWNAGQALICRHPTAQLAVTVRESARGMPGRRGERKPRGRDERKLDTSKEAKNENEEQRGSDVQEQSPLHPVRDGVVGDDARPAMVLIAMEPSSELKPSIAFAFFWRSPAAGHQPRHSPGPFHDHSLPPRSTSLQREGIKRISISFEKKQTYLHSMAHHAIQKYGGIAWQLLGVRARMVDLPGPGIVLNGFEHERRGIVREYQRHRLSLGLGEDFRRLFLPSHWRQEFRPTSERNRTSIHIKQPHQCTESIDEVYITLPLIGRVVPVI
ncbi:hypothetical protein B0H13DRAFT_1866478 [Mycena leptocephala]|nr:hypothetical protein B0H13DRAFT_1866478 [Mycena leptocephala]